MSGLNINATHGFTLVEFSIVLAIAGFTGLVLFTVFMNTIQLKTSEDRFDKIKFALAEHLRVRGSLPCPADPFDDSGDATYGFSQNCTATPSIVVAGPNGTNVVVGAVPFRDLRVFSDCEWRDSQQTLAAQATALTNTSGVTITADEVEVLRKNINTVGTMIASAFAAGPTGNAADNIVDQKVEDTSCLSGEDTIDEYNNKILYAVTQSATDPGLYDQNAGEIRIVDQNGNQSTQNDVLFVLVSFGEDGKGAISADGIVSGIACGPATGARDNENCNFTADSIFRNMPFSTAQGNTFYDDRVDFSLAGHMREHEYWDWGDRSQTPQVAQPANINIPAGPDNRVMIDIPVNVIVNPNDILVVTRSDMRVTGGDLDVQVDITAGTATNSGNVAGADVGARNAFYAPQFCYDPPITAACN